MINSKELFYRLLHQLTLEESQTEKEEIIFFLLETVLGLTKTQILSEHIISSLDIDFSHYINRLNVGEPIQYVVGWAFFWGRKFRVNPNVLIPRPETEWLVAEVVRDKPVHPHIVDIGTGSGCIAISLALELPTAQVFALDNSLEALHVAQYNRKLHQAEVSFIQRDMLTDPIPDCKTWDYMVSNPPYLFPSDVDHTSNRIKQYEPHQALWPPGDDPFLYYKKLSESIYGLKKNGHLIAEVHPGGDERYYTTLIHIFQKAGFKNVKIKGEDPFPILFIKATR